MKYGKMPLCDSWASIYAYKNEDLIERSFLRCEDYVHPSIPIYKYKCTSIIKTKKEKFRIRLILPDLTAIGLILSHASHCSNTRHTAQ